MFSINEEDSFMNELCGKDLLMLKVINNESEVQQLTFTYNIQDVGGPFTVDEFIDVGCPNEIK